MNFDLKKLLQPEKLYHMYVRGRDGVLVYNGTLYWDGGMSFRRTKESVMALPTSQIVKDFYANRIYLIPYYIPLIGQQYYFLQDKQICCATFNGDISPFLQGNIFPDEKVAASLLAQKVRLRSE